jgi:hypothetical protein
MKTTPDDAVVEWLNEQDSGNLYVASVTIGEIEYGLRILPNGRRRDQLRERFARFIAQAFAMRILPYDEIAARVYGDLMGLRKEMGRPLSVPDGQIAAIARVGGYALGTRNIKDFQDCGIELINPFKIT